MLLAYIIYEIKNHQDNCLYSNCVRMMTQKCFLRKKNPWNVFQHVQNYDVLPESGMKHRIQKLSPNRLEMPFALSGLRL